MGDIMAQIGREVWGMNMVGTVQCNRSGAPDTKVTTTKMKAGTYESTMWQHNNLCLQRGVTTASSRRCQTVTGR